MRLASQLTGWDIDILTEAEESERRQKEFVERTKSFMNAIDVDEVVGRLLASEGFRSVEELAFVDLPELAVDRRLRRGDRRAKFRTARKNYLERIEAENEERRKALGVADELREIDGLTTAMMVKLGENDVKTMEDFAGCVPDDLVGWSEKKDGETVKHEGFFEGIDLSREEAEAMIMTARVRAGWIEEPVATAVEAEAKLRRKANSGFDRGHDARAACSERTCIVTRQRGAPEAMIRFVRGPDGALAPDIKAQPAGPRRLGDGARRRRRAGGAKASVRARAEDADRRRAATRRGRRPIARSRLSADAVARQQGGRRRRPASARSPTPSRKALSARLIEARDGGEDGKRKLAQAARRAGSDGAPSSAYFRRCNWIWRWAAQM